MIIIYIILLIILIFCLFVLILKNKILKLEDKIIRLFSKRNDLIPSIYEITKYDFIKHNEVFSKILQLKKINFMENKIKSNIYKIINTQKLIHNELNFIFKVSEKHNKLNKNYKFLYIKDILIETSSKIGNDLKIYKKIIKKLNLLIFIKNITIIGIIIPIKKIEEIEN